jgi:hypothetical protein
MLELAATFALNFALLGSDGCFVAEPLTLSNLIFGALSRLIVVFGLPQGDAAE